MRCVPNLRIHSVQTWILTVIIVLGSRCVYSQAPTYFEDAVAPILRKNCIACHNVKLAEGGLNLETPANITQGGDAGSAIDTKAPEASLLIARASGSVEPIMPPDGNTVGAERLTADQLAILKAWVAGGALSKGGVGSMPNIANFRLPETARASYAVAMSPNNDFLAFGRGGSLVVHNARRTALPTAIEGMLDPATKQVIPHAHPDFIYAVAISPDGKTIATGSTAQVKLWRQSSDPIEANRIALEAAHVPWALLTAVSPDGTLLATAEAKAVETKPVDVPAGQTNGGEVPAPAETQTTVHTEIRMLGRDGAIRRHLIVPEPQVIQAAWSPSNQRFFAVSGTNALYAWDLSAEPITAPSKTPLPSAVKTLAAIDETTLWIGMDRKQSVWQFKTPALAELIPDTPVIAAMNAAGPIDILAVSQDRTQCVTGIQDDASGVTSLKLWSLSQAKLVGNIERDRKEQLKLAAAERDTRRAQAAVDRSNAAVAELDKALQAEGTAVTNAQAAKEKAVQALATKTQEVQTAMQGVMDQEKMLEEAKAAPEPDAAKVTQLTTEVETKKKALAELEKQKNTLQTAMENAAQSLVSTEESQKAAQQRLEERKQLVVKQTEALTASQAITAQNKAAADAVRYSLSSIALCGKNVLAGLEKANTGNASTIDLFSLESLDRIETRPCPTLVSSGAMLSAIVHAGSEKSWQPLLTLETLGMIVDRVNALAFSPDGTKLAIGSGMPSRSGQLTLVNVSEEKLAAIQSQAAAPEFVAMPDLHSDTLQGLAFSPDGRYLATCGADKMTKLIDLQTNAVAKVFEGHTHHVLALAWQEAGQLLVTASADASVKVWDIERGESTKTIPGFGTEVTATAFVGPTPNVVSTTLNNLIRMHDVNGGNQVKQFGPVGDSLYSVAVSLNGKYVIGVGQEGIARVWQIDDGRLVAEFP